MKVESAIFGVGTIRNPNNAHQHIQFSDQNSPRLWVWPDGTYSLGGPNGTLFEGKIEDIDNVTSEIKRLMKLVGK